MAEVAVTGIGMVTPLGYDAGVVLDAVRKQRTAAAPSPFFRSMACPVYAPVPDFDAARYFPENKTLRLMNRDAQMAVVAAHGALNDAAIVPGTLYPAEEIALYGATGLTGLPAEEIVRLVENAAAPDGSLDLDRFGQVALKRIRPVLSFKILANMPICFVSIFENLRGPNAVYTPWEGHGAEAIAAGVDAVANEEVPCAVVGGCDVKTHAFSFVALQQFGVFDAWSQHGDGCIPGEGAAFLVLENREKAVQRGATIYAVIRRHTVQPTLAQNDLADTFCNILQKVGADSTAKGPCVVAAGDGDPHWAQAEQTAIHNSGLASRETIYPKRCLGNLFAAAACVQVALAAQLVSQSVAPTSVLANCFGHGNPQAAFWLEAV
jgi:3-oxoacyl-[acyl-carrier-protein] synthase II